jgi:hypothetical protein
MQRDGIRKKANFDKFLCNSKYQKKTAKKQKEK